MIDKSCGTYDLICDNCGEALNETFEDFDDAVQAKKDNGWTSKKVNGQWMDICDECGGVK